LLLQGREELREMLISKFKVNFLPEVALPRKYKMTGDDHA
jgi:hypothetical protein